MAWLGSCVLQRPAATQATNPRYRAWLDPSWRWLKQRSTLITEYQNLARVRKLHHVLILYSYQLRDAHIRSTQCDSRCLSWSRKSDIICTVCQGRSSRITSINVSNPSDPLKYPSFHQTAWTDQIQYPHMQTWPSLQTRQTHASCTHRQQKPVSRSGNTHTRSSPSHCRQAYFEKLSGYSRTLSRHASVVSGLFWWGNRPMISGTASSSRLASKRHKSLAHHWRTRRYWRLPRPRRPSRCWGCGLDCLPSTG